MNLIIDHGNTRTKAAVFDGNTCIYLQKFDGNFERKSIIKLIKDYPCQNAIFSGVGKVKTEWIELLEQNLNLIVLCSETPVPFKNEYKTPETLGVDRIALIAAAYQKYSNKNVLVIDAGTCITYDFLDSRGCYHGGAISPGLNMRYKALNTFTDKLPLTSHFKYAKLTGKTTLESMHSGVVNGVIGEIDSVITMYKKKNKDLTVVLTGGDVKFLANSLKNGIFANPIFLLEGLNAILTYNLV
jgi:type III pantothenate kinase